MILETYGLDSHISETVVLILGSEGLRIYTGSYLGFVHIHATVY